MKKIKEKYADQDEEERQLRMDILAVSIYIIYLDTYTHKLFLSTCPENIT